MTMKTLRVNLGAAWPTGFHAAPLAVQAVSSGGQVPHLLGSLSATIAAQMAGHDSEAPMHKQGA